MQHFWEGGVSWAAAEISALGKAVTAGTAAWREAAETLVFMMQEPRLSEHIEVLRRRAGLSERERQRERDRERDREREVRQLEERSREIERLTKEIERQAKELSEWKG